jgi:hypothetical protein
LVRAEKIRPGVIFIRDGKLAASFIRDDVGSEKRDCTGRQPSGQGTKYFYRTYKPSHQILVKMAGSKGPSSQLLEG